MRIEGVIAALVTPYNDYGGIDTDGVGQLVERAIAGGASGVLVNGPVGEAPHLSRGERIFVFEAAVAAADGRVPVYAGTGAVGTEETLALTWDAAKAGVAAAFVATPFYFPLPQAALLDHYRYLARRGRLPLVPVADPAAVGNTLEPATLAELANIDGVAGVALAAPDSAALRETVALIGEPGRISIAHDSLLPAARAMGLGGVVSRSAGLLPGEVVALMEAVQTTGGTVDTAHWTRLQPLIAMLTDPLTGVAACKAAATALGLPGGAPRSPLPGADSALVATVEAALAVARGQ